MQNPRTTSSTEQATGLGWCQLLPVVEPCRCGRTEAEWTNPSERKQVVAAGQATKSLGSAVCFTVATPGLAVLATLSSMSILPQPVANGCSELNCSKLRTWIRWPSPNLHCLPFTNYSFGTDRSPRNKIPMWFDLVREGIRSFPRQASNRWLEKVGVTWRISVRL